MPQNWLEFWQKKNNFDEKMHDNYNFFLSKVEDYITLSKDLTVLDWGSGPGHLADAWHNKVKAIHGADVSERYNAIASAKHSNHSNIFFHHINPTDYLNLNILPDIKFNLVIVMSVLQYYRNKEEVKQLLKNLLTVTTSGATIVLADLIIHSGLWRDLLGLLKQSIKKGTFFSVLFFILQLRFSRYYYVKKKQGLLVISETEWKAMLDELQLDYTIITEPITLQKDRKSILIQLK